MQNLSFDANKLLLVNRWQCKRNRKFLRHVQIFNEIIKVFSTVFPSRARSTQIDILYFPRSHCSVYDGADVGLKFSMKMWNCILQVTKESKISLHNPFSPVLFYPSSSMCALFGEMCNCTLKPRGLSSPLHFIICGALFIYVFLHHLHDINEWSNYNSS